MFDIILLNSASDYLAKSTFQNKERLKKHGYYNKSMYISIGKVATMMGVAISSLRRWDNDGKLLADSKTIENHRRCKSQTIIKYLEQHYLQRQPVQEQVPKTAIVYCRVSGSRQKKYLETQRQFLENYIQQQQ